MNIIITMPDLDKQGYKELVKFYKKLKGFIYYKVPFLPKQTKKGERCLIVSNGVLVGSHEIVDLRFVSREESVRLSHGDWGEGFYIIRDAKTFKKFKREIKFKGFRGFRYLETLTLKIAKGEWR